MALSLTNISNILFKAKQGKSSTNDVRQFFEEPRDGRAAVYTNQIWSNSGDIPSTAPGGIDQAITGVVQRWIDLVLTAVPGVSNSFYSDNLIDAIPFNFGDGSYNYGLKDSTGTAIAFGQGDWIVDPDTGTLTFYGTVPSNMPPKISFYKYVGEKGAGSGSGEGGVNFLASKNASFESASNDWVKKNANPGNSIAVDTTGESITVSAAFGGYVGMPLLYTNSGGTVIGGLTSGNTYYIQSLPVSSAFTLSATPGGALIDLTSVGSGTHNFVALDPGQGNAGTSSNLTLTRSTTNPLLGKGSMTIAKGAANARGELTSVLTDTLPIGYLGTPVACSFLVDASDTNFVTGDMKYYLFDVTNQKMINISSPTSQQIPNGKALLQFWAYPLISCTSINLELFVATVNAAAYTIKVDSFKIRPAVDWQSSNLVANMTSDVAFTPTGSWISNVTYSGLIRQVGNWAVIQYKVVCSGAPTSASLTFNMPTINGVTLQVDTAKLLTDASGQRIPQTVAEILDSGTTQYVGYLAYSGSNTISARINSSSPAAPGPVTQASPMTWASGDTFVGEIALPILGWSATSPYLITNADEFLNESTTFVQKTTALTGDEAPGTYNVFTGAVNSITAATLSASAPTQTNADMSVNGLRIFAKNYGNASTAASPARLDIVIGKGMKYVEVYGYRTTGKTDALFKGYTSIGTGTNTLVKLETLYDEKTGIISLDGAYIPSSSITSRYVGLDRTNSYTDAYFFIRASKKNAATGVGIQGVSFRAYKNGGAVTSVTTIPTWTTVKDLVGAFNATTGVYTVKEAGDYQLNFHARITASVAAYARVYVNGNTIDTGTSVDSATTHAVSTLLTGLVVGDQVDVRLNANATIASDTVGTVWSMFKTTG